MSEYFSPLALQWAGLTCRAYGWNPAQFWQATPAEIIPLFTAQASDTPSPPSRAEIHTMMEQERHG